jgi:2-methylcitrate dehydratase PrpD
MTIAAELAQIVTRTPFDRLPPLALDHAAMLIASTLASAASGYDIASSRIIRELASEQAGTPESSIWFDSGPKIPAVNACRVNAVMSDAAASDDSDLRTIVHLGTPLTATTLALAERTGADGKQVLAAIVLGYETAGRIGAAVMPAYRNRGFHGCIVAIFGAAVASAILLRLDQRQMAQAIALAAVSIGGLSAAADTSLAREYFAGNAAMLGMNAALAAHKGYLAEDGILEISNGYFDVYGGEDVGSVTRDWGSEWDIVTDMAIKLVPGAHPSHALGEAAANAAREGNVSADEVETITMAQPVNARLRTGPMKPPSHPRDLVDAAHTPAYFVAAGVADKNFSWAHATTEKILDPVIHQLIDKIKIGEPPQNDERFRHGATVTIKTRDGRSFTSTVHAPRGSGARGIDWADVDDKYRILVAATGLSAQKIDDGLSFIHELRSARNISNLTSLLR